MKFISTIFLLFSLLIFNSCSSKKATSSHDNIQTEDIISDEDPVKGNNEITIISDDNEEISLDGDLQSELNKYEKSIGTAQADSIFDDESKIEAFNNSIKTDIQSVYSSNEEVEEAFIDPEDEFETVSEINNANEIISAEEVEVQAVSNATSDNIYEVQEQETLILVAFKIYGDIKKWRELASLNQEVLTDGHNLTPGMKLKIMPPETDFRWRPDGTAYLIKYKDTLGKISHNVYGKNRYWRSIWKNNETLIKDPDLIFAGFTIYYLPFDQVIQSYKRNISSESEQL